MLLYSSEVWIAVNMMLTLQQFFQLKVLLKILFSGSSNVWFSVVQIISWLWFAVDDLFVMNCEGIGKYVLSLHCCDHIWHAVCLSYTCWMEKSDTVRDVFIPLLLWLTSCYEIQYAVFFSSPVYNCSFFPLKKTSCYIKNVFKYFHFLNTWGFAIYFFTGTEPVQ